MAVPKVKYAFCGCSLEVGTKIIAYLHVVIFSILFIINMLFETVPDETINKSEELSFPNQTDFNITNKEKENLQKQPEISYYFYINDSRTTYFLIYTVFIQLIFSLYLLCGLLQRKHEYLFVWPLLQMACFGHSVVVVIMNLMYTLVEYPGYAISFITEEIACSAFELYCALIVYNYLRQLIKNEEDGSQYFT